MEAFSSIQTLGVVTADISEQNKNKCLLLQVKLCLANFQEREREGVVKAPMAFYSFYCLIQIKATHSKRCASLANVCKLDMFKVYKTRSAC